MIPTLGTALALVAATVVGNHLNHPWLDRRGVRR